MALALEAGALGPTAVPLPRADREELRPPARGRLAPPAPARPRLRRLLDPVTGWLRRKERAFNQFLTHRFYPHVPLVHLPYGLQLERGLTVSEATVVLPGLGPALAGTRLLLITDPHAGPFLSPRSLERAFRRLASLEPDVIAIGGDFATTCVREFVPTARVFASLTAPLGVFGVMGNHDHYTEDPSRLKELVRGTGLRLLDNEAVEIRRGEDRLVLAGIDDLNSGSPDIEKTMATARGLSSADGAPIVLLSHNPDVFFDAARLGASLVLAGHTHAGQVRIPGLPVLVRMSRYGLDEGRYRVDGSELIVSRGLGVCGVPVRIACAPEAVLIRLERA